MAPMRKDVEVLMARIERAAPAGDAQLEKGAGMPREAGHAPEAAHGAPAEHGPADAAHPPAQDAHISPEAKEGADIH
jgi:NADH-quinone oxidoreductase subunit M